MDQLSPGQTIQLHMHVKGVYIIIILVDGYIIHAGLTIMEEEHKTKDRCLCLCVTSSVCGWYVHAHAFTHDPWRLSCLVQIIKEAQWKSIGHTLQNACLSIIQCVPAEDKYTYGKPEQPTQ